VTLPDLGVGAAIVREDTGGRQPKSIREIPVSEDGEMKLPIVFTDHVGLWALLLCVLTMHAPSVQAITKTSAGLKLGPVGTWQVRFDPAASSLELIHQASGARVAGKYLVRRDGGRILVDRTAEAINGLYNTPK
jgi:hypothetical protein